MRDEQDYKDNCSDDKLKMIYIFIGLGIMSICMILIIIYMSKNNEGIFIEYNNLNKSLYIENLENYYTCTENFTDHFLDFLSYNNYTKLYLYIGCLKLNLYYLQIEKDLMEKLMNNSIKVYISLNLIDYSQNENNLTDDVNFLAECFKNKTLNFSGVHLDLDRIYNNDWDFTNILGRYKDYITYNLSNFEHSVSLNADFESKDSFSFISSMDEIMYYIDNKKQLDSQLYNISQRKNSSPIFKFEYIYSTYSGSKENQTNFFKDFNGWYKNYTFKDITIKIPDYETWYEYLYCVNLIEKDYKFYFRYPNYYDKKRNP